MRGKLVQHVLPGVAEWCVPQVVPQSDSLGQIFVEAKGPRYGPGNLADFKGVGQAGAVVIPFRGEENLRFVGEPPEALAVNDPVAVLLVLGAQLAWVGEALPSPGIGTQRGKGAECLFFPLKQLLPDRQTAPPFL